MKTVFALFKDYQNAEEAVDRLLERGFSQEEMNIIVQESTVDNFIDTNQRTANVNKTSKLGQETLFGLDQMLAGRQPVATTDAGKVRAAGDVASVMTRMAVAPGSTMEFEEVLRDFGLKDADAKAYLDGLQAGDLLFFIPTGNERLAEVYNLLRQYKASQVSSNQD